MFHRKKGAAGMNWIFINFSTTKKNQAIITSHDAFHIYFHRRPKLLNNSLASSSWKQRAKFAAGTSGAAIFQEHFERSTSERNHDARTTEQYNETGA